MTKKKISRTKIGDIFAVSINEHEVRYFQLIAFDLTQLNSDVIRVFEGVYRSCEKLEVDKLVLSSVDFYAHCVTKIGLELDMWEKVANSLITGSLDHILFRSTSDRKVDISHEWWIWKVNQSRKFVGSLSGENTKAHIGLVFPPKDIVNRLKTGKYLLVYPQF